MSGTSASSGTGCVGDVHLWTSSGTFIPAGTKCVCGKKVLGGSDSGNMGSLQQDIEQALRFHKRDRISETPIATLAKYMLNCLAEYEMVVAIRNSCGSSLRIASRLDKDYPWPSKVELEREGQREVYIRQSGIPKAEPIRRRWACDGCSAHCRMQGIKRPSSCPLDLDRKMVWEECGSLPSTDLTP